LIGGSYILQPEGYGCVCICSKGGDERCLIFFLKSDLVVTRVAVVEGEQDAASHRVDYLVDAWEHEGILHAVLVQISIIHTHPPFIIILFQD
jgi:hypothetical protein